MTAAAHPSTALERHDIQGLLLSAYGHLPWSAYVLLRIDDAARARSWLGSLAGTVTNACGKHHGHSTNLALSYSGLQKLGFPGAAGAFVPAFVDGMASERRARILGDTDASAPSAWEWGHGARAVDVLLMLFAHDEAALETALATHRSAWAGALSEVRVLRARRHPDGKEHFGFSDGIAQPAMRGEGHSEPARRRTNPDNDVAAGEFILGYPNEYGPPSAPSVAVAAAADPGDRLGSGAGPRDFGRNGTYLVLRQLEQDVAGFWGFLDRAVRTNGGADPPARVRLAAKLVGRWPSGAPLIKAPLTDERCFANDNDFGFAADPHGLRCPVGSHIRRANPRDSFLNDTAREAVRRSNRHRILRRGRPYGKRIADALTPDGEPRGLVFIGLNSDIERQFEFVQQTWLNNPTFCGLRDEVDPLTGTQSGAAFMTVPGEPLRRRLRGIPNFVTTKGGAYFFLPGLRALRYLAALDPAAVASAAPAASEADDRWRVDPELGEYPQPHEREIAERMAATIAATVAQQFRDRGSPARRDAHARAHGCVRAILTVDAPLPAELAKGVFVPGAQYSAWVRFSNGSGAVDRPDSAGDVRAMAVKLLDVRGPKLLAQPSNAQTQDFILLNSPVFPACDARGYLTFIERQGSANPLKRLCGLAALGWTGALIALRMQRSRIANPLTTRYWSAVPFRLGDAAGQQAVKLSAIPRTAAGPIPRRPAPQYLRAAMADLLSERDAAFDLVVQCRAAGQSVEDSRAEWSETAAPFRRVATLVILKQEFTTAERDALAENLAFNPWHALPAHRPLGSINRARRVVYETIADLRRRFNEAPLDEPTA